MHEYFGVNSLAKLSLALEHFKPTKIFLISGHNSFINSGAKDKILPIINNKYNFTHFDRISVNPNIETIQPALQAFHDACADLIIAVGGGSVIDTAKCVNSLTLIDSDHKALEAKIADLCKQQIKKKVPLIAIPTTSGSGSEATHFAVIYIGKKKYSLASQDLQPDVAIVDPTLTYNLPTKITAISALDALAQAIEAYWAVGATSESDSYAEQAIQLILPALQLAYEGDEEAKNAMSLGAHYAGKAINITKTTGPHALSYILTSLYGIAHGQAVFLSLGKFFVINGELQNKQINQPLGITYHDNKMHNLYSLLKVNDYEEACQFIYSIMDNFSLEYRLSKLGINAEKLFNELQQYIDLERLANNPVKITPELYKHCYVYE